MLRFEMRIMLKYIFLEITLDNGTCIYPQSSEYENYECKLHSSEM